MKYDFKIMDNKLFLCCITLFAMMLLNFIKSSSHLLKLLARSHMCVCIFDGSAEPRGSVEDAMLCYAMLCYAMDKPSYDMLAIVNRY